MTAVVTDPTPPCSLHAIAMVDAYGVRGPTAPLAPVRIPRRSPGARDVELEILYCGVCGSDLRSARNDWGQQPCVPGHEIIGRVVQVGSAVTRFAPGVLAAVGGVIDSCRICTHCRAGREQYCSAAIFTCNSPDQHLGGHTFGGYARSIVVDEAFVLRVPAGLDPAAAAPLLCAGITVYAPLRRWRVGPGQKVGVVGLGGLGHLAIRFARALGARVVLFTTSPAKVADGFALGAHEVAVVHDTDAMWRQQESCDLILDTVPVHHDLATYLAMLALDGTLVLVGAPEEALAVPAISLLAPRRQIAGSALGGIAETQEMLDFCAQHGIVAEVEVIAMQQINEAWERVAQRDVRYRFVIDMAEWQP